MMHSGRVRICILTVARDDSVEGGDEGRKESRNAGCGHIHRKEKDDDECGKWREEGRLMAAFVIANGYSWRDEQVMRQLRSVMFFRRRRHCC